MVEKRMDVILKDIELAYRRFPVCWVNRSDVTWATGDPRSKHLTEREMFLLAEEMNDFICDGMGYWDALKAAYKKIKKKRRGTHVGI